MENGASTFLSELIRRGGVYEGVEGVTAAAALTNLVRRLKPPGSLDRDALLRAVLEREELMPTAAGGGIALPHPRNPVVTEERSQFAAVAYLRTPVDWGALDGQSVHSAILIVSASAKSHLATLSRLSYFCGTEGFQTLLAARAPLEDLCLELEETERIWL
jgi:PTS system nitrogen regulatory IIA component